ncbi:hypothetical protein E2P81_ATG01358 [Venturia nashicola]|nr:hypothetical protein E2P81_ATG01358 [Venturia nashicola]
MEWTGGNEADCTESLSGKIDMISLIGAEVEFALNNHGKGVRIIQNPRSCGMEDLQAPDSFEQKSTRMTQRYGTEQASEEI